MYFEMLSKKIVIFLVITSLTNFSQTLSAEPTLLSRLEEKKLTLEQQLGKQLFFDTNLSSPPGQSCASCHDIKTSLTDTTQNSPVSPGAVAGRTGTRNTPSAAYSAFAPGFHF
ncbi:secreted protein containing Di-haem cytochrome c peroxidase domain, partial [methanotrophic bacterial endosymbiont of Bathymodiolus sp.]